MATAQYVVVLLILALVSKSISRPIIRTTPEELQSARPDPISDGAPVRAPRKHRYCESWRFSVETNDAGVWTQIPATCEKYVKKYMNGHRYRYDSDVVAVDASAFAEKVNVSGDGMDAWVFDIDETLLSNLPYYATVRYGFGKSTCIFSGNMDRLYKLPSYLVFERRLEEFNETSWDKWVDLAEAPALPASLKLYKELQQLGFTIFLLTGREESQRNVTVKNLKDVGYSNWKRLILRGESDSGTPAIVYKSEKRKEVKDEGYTIHGSSGDQWSDLLGFAIAERSFKLPNPMYYIA
ncbi:hypothetical protein RHMOL_Rhmol05G0036000 [Rhododendron molle]|uniref:Uncharacterized protein n=1 Tax=Rhododendron molle TaxID=49168 RepID=A0ACC0NK04_RHOML|nr:hypothetical protein RHMOL_Rhmol05G0036000 [Rhododendron molle]